MTDNHDRDSASLLAGVRGSALVSTLLAVGMVGIFAGERLLGAGRGRTVLTAGGAVLVAVALALRALRVLGARGDRRWIERRALDGMALAAVALLLYFLQSDLCSFLFHGKPMAAGWPKLAIGLQVIWPATWLAGTVSLLLIELSYASMARAPRLETGRVRDAFLSGLGFSFVLVFAFSAAYVASERDKRLDLSYFRTTRPGEATRKLVRTFDAPVHVTWFYPAGSDVREELRGYFQDLARESPNLAVQGLDQAVDPVKAKELGATANGVVVFSKGGRKEQLQVGIDLEQAKNQLRTLDKDVQKRLLQVARPGRTVYLTTGHGERTSDSPVESEKRTTIRDLRASLQELNYTLHDLGAAEGLGAEVPTDAGVVMVIGPQKAFLPEEVAALSRFLDRGGRLFLALDPEAGLDFKELLGPLGVIYHPQTLLNDQNYAKRANQPSDRANIVTASYSSNPSVQTLSKAHGPTVYLGAGWLEEVPFKDRPKGVTVDMAIHALSQTWADLDGNFTFDGPREGRRAYDLAAAITRKRQGTAATAGGASGAGGAGNDEARVFVLADSDAIADVALVVLANRYLLFDPARWLVGDDAIGGETASEVDQPIAHTHGQDVVWFYATIFLAPLLALGVGWLATRKQRRTRARPSGTVPRDASTTREAA